MLDLEMKGPLSDNVKATVLRDAETLVNDKNPPRNAVIQAVVRHFVEANAFDMRPIISGAIDTARMIYGADTDITPHVEATAAQSGLVLSSDAWKRIVTEAAGNPEQITAAALMAALGGKPPTAAMHQGKWLSKMGIVKAEVESIAPAGHVEPAGETPHDGSPDAAALPPAEPNPQANVVRKLSPRFAAVADMPGHMHPREGQEPLYYVDGEWREAEYDIVVQNVTAPAQAPVGVATSSPAVVLAGQPSSEASPEEIAVAFQAFGAALSSKDEELAKRIGISRTTLYNSISGKTAKPKCTLDHARILLAEIDTRMAKLREAAEIFARVR